jgi:hypothetical protein
MTIWDMFDLRFNKFREADEVILSDNASKEDLLWLAVKKNDVIKSGEKLLKVVDIVPESVVQIVPTTKIIAKI